MSLRTHFRKRMNQLAFDTALSTTESYTRMCESFTRFYSSMDASDPARRRRRKMIESRESDAQADTMLNEGGREQ